MTQNEKSATPVCRVFRPEIEDHDRYSGSRGRPIRVETAPSATVPVEKFVAALAPGKRIEHLARREMAQLDRYGEVDPSCLFFRALHACFSEHYAFTIRPEVLMHLIVGEVAITVNKHPEAYRALFTRSDKKERIDVTHNGLALGNPDSPWGEAIDLFERPLREKVPPGIMEHLLPPLSTATAESRTASLVAFMDAAQKFYDFHTHTMCGVPEIRLAGTADDYKRVLTAASQLSEPFRAHLGRYFDHLLPVLKKIADQAAGAPVDDKFWGSIYKYESHSGTSAFNGWSAAFVNYVQTAEIPSSQYYKGSVGEVVEKHEKLYDWEAACAGGYLAGLSVGSLPSHVSSAPFTWHYMGQELKMRFMGGILGVDNDDDALMPVLSYAVLHDE